MARKVRGKIDLKDWDLVIGERKVEKIIDSIETDLDKTVEKLRDKLSNKIFCDLVKTAASEALNYASRDQFAFDLFDRKRPAGTAVCEVCFSDYDCFTWEQNLRAMTKSAIISWGDRSRGGRIDDRVREHFADVANELRACAALLDKALSKGE